MNLLRKGHGNGAGPCETEATVKSKDGEISLDV